MPKTMAVDTPRGRIVIQLSGDASVATTVAHFEKLANEGFFDGLTFHRVEDWVIQGGDPEGTGSGGAKMPAEYNNIPFLEGSVGVARGPDRRLNSDCQWFILKRDTDRLNGDYTNFGMVTSGMDVVAAIVKGDKIEKVRVSEQG